MDKERKIDAQQIDRLFDFLDILQASGYKINPRQYVALNDLLMILIAEGKSLNGIALKTLIAPIICSSPNEQQDFYQRFDYWYPTWIAAKQSDGFIKQNPKKWKPKFNNINWKFWLSILLGIILIVIFVIISQYKYYETFVLFAILLGVILIIGGWQVWVLYEENQFITRGMANQEPMYTKLLVGNYIRDLVPVMEFKPIVISLKRRSQIQSKEVDVERTIETALQRDNWLEIICRQRQIIPEYLVLIERKSRLDQQAHFILDVLHRLATEGVWLHQYEFTDDPSICFPLGKKDSPLQLSDLQTRYPDSRLLVFISRNDLINPLTGHLQDWLKLLSNWKEHAILTPDKIQNVFIDDLQGYNFVILPMTHDGLASLVQTFERGNVQLKPNGLRPLPARLEERPMRWIGRNMPPITEVNALVEAIRQYLGKNGFYWLCANAVYPELRWELTLYLGNTLKDKSNKSLITPDLLLNLARLSWFRFGYMPDWFRRVLIDQLSGDDEQSVRIALVTLLATLSGLDSFSLNIGQEGKRSLASRTRKFINFLKKNTDPTHPVHDYIFLRFLLGIQKRKLSIKPPETIRRVLKGIPVSRTTTSIVTLLETLRHIIKGNSTSRVTLGRGRIGDSLFSDIGKLWLEWRGKDKAVPQYRFQENEIVSPPYFRKVSRFSQATFVNLHPTHFAVAISSDGRMINLKGGYNMLPPGYYNIHYVDKQNRINEIPRTAETTLDGFQVAMELVISYRVIDPIKALEVQRPVDTLIRFIQANLKEFIRSHKYEEIVGDLDGRKIDNEQVAVYIKEKLIDRLPLAKLFYIIDVLVNERIGDPSVIELRKKYQISQKQLDNQKALQTMNQELEKKVADHDALIKQIKANSAVAQQNTIQQVEMQKIELEKARADFKYRQENWGKAVNAIVQTLSNQTHPPDSEEYKVIAELLDELGGSSYQSRESFDVKHSVKSEEIGTMKGEPGENTNNATAITNIDQTKSQNVELEQIRKQYEMSLKAMDTVEQIYTHAIDEKRSLTPDEARTIEKLNDGLTNPSRDRINELSNTLLNWRKK